MNVVMRIILFSVFQNLLNTLVYGIVLYPNFACLTTEHKLIGSVLGFLYSALRYKSTIIYIFVCSPLFKVRPDRSIDCRAVVKVHFSFSGSFLSYPLLSAAQKLET